jgi:hypothetical protein
MVIFAGRTRLRDSLQEVETGVKPTLALERHIIRRVVDCGVPST